MCTCDGGPARIRCKIRANPFSRFETLAGSHKLEPFLDYGLYIHMLMLIPMKSLPGFLAKIPVVPFPTKGSRTASLTREDGRMGLPQISSR